MQAANADSQISPDQWDWVRDLIRDLEREEKRDEFLRQLFQWDVAVREFRKAEQSRMILGTPNERDLSCHAICLHLLLAIGHSLNLQAAGFPPGDLLRCKVEPEQIASYVEELEQSLREWHHGFTSSDVKKAQDAIFGGEA